MSERPTFEECAVVVARYLVEGGDANGCAQNNQNAHGYDSYKLLDRARELVKADPSRFHDLSHEYSVVAEMLEYFDSYRLATWAPVASIFERERKYGQDHITRLESDVATFRKLLADVLDTSGARGTYHSLKYAEAVEAAEEALSRISGEDRT